MGWRASWAGSGDVGRTPEPATPWRCPTRMPLTGQRTDIYRQGDVSVDLKVEPGARLVRVRVWSGGRWKRVERTYLAKHGGWFPWFSVERQAARAIEYANRRVGVHLPRDEVRRIAAGALRAVL